MSNEPQHRNVESVFVQFRKLNVNLQDDVQAKDRMSVALSSIIKGKVGACEIYIRTDTANC